MWTKSGCPAHWVLRAICVDVINSWVCDASVAFGALEDFWRIFGVGVFERWGVGALERWSVLEALEHWRV